MALGAEGWTDPKVPNEPNYELHSALSPPKMYIDVAADLIFSPKSIESSDSHQATVRDN